MASSESNEAEEVEAVVSAVKGEGNDRFAVAYPTHDSSLISAGTTITFSLSEWEGGHEPRRGQVVILTEVEKFAKGWRARRARPIRLTGDLIRKEKKQ